MNNFLFDENTMVTEGMVSVSQLQTFMGCPKKWEYGYVKNLTPRVDRPYLTIGKLCHKGMQVAMQVMWQYQQPDKCDGSPLDKWEDMFTQATYAIRTEWDEYMESHPFLAEEIPEQKQILADALDVFTQALEEFEPWRYEVYTITDKNGWHRPALELHFVVPCTGSKGLHGFIDAILIERDTGYIWCTDYKFRKQLSPDEEEITNIQNAVYTHACDKLGIPITGTMTWQHTNIPASIPSVNKNGAISRAKIKTTWKKFAEFCTLNGQNPEFYREEMEPKLAENEFCRATYESRNPIFMDHIWKEVVVPAARAVAAAKKRVNNPRYLYPWNCKMCQFKDLCQAELRDHDANFLCLTEYMVRPSVNRVVDTNVDEVV